jgi:anti-sigma factor RsiW
MRGRISDQDLTDYALNELQPEERLYIESILAVSEECRNDIYEMIEMSQLLEEGFEREEAKLPAMLTGEQRLKLLAEPRGPNPFQKAAAVLGLAACAAFVITQPGSWNVEEHAGTMANVSTQVTKIVAQAVRPEGREFTTSFATLRSFAEDPAKWLPADVRSEASTICTPPSWLEQAQMTAFSEVNQ